MRVKRKIRIRKERKSGLNLFCVTLLCMSYFCLLQLLYCKLLQPIYEYAGFFLDFSAIRCIIACVMLIPAIFYLNKCGRHNAISWNVVGIILLSAYIPSLVLYIFMDAQFILLYFIYFCILMAATILFKDIKLRIQIKNSTFILSCIGTIIGILTIYVWGKYSNFHLQLSFLNVYGQREISSEYNIPRIFRYFFGMTPSIIPLFAVYYLEQRKYLKVIYYTVLQYIVFCVYAEKTSMFYLAIALFAYYGIKNYEHILNKISKLLIVGLFGAFVEYKLLNTTYITSVLFRRILFIPSKLNYVYYNFFTENAFDYFRASVLRFIFRSPYADVGIARTIGIYMGTGDSANNGLFSDAYANIGIIGIFIMPVLVALLLKILDQAAKQLQLKTTFIAIVITAGVLVSSSFFTCLITHGLIMIMIILCLIPPKTDSRAKDKSQNEVF